MFYNEKAAIEKLVASNIKFLRTEHQPCLSQELLSRKLGVSRRTFNNYENAQTSIPLWFALLVAKFFKISLEDLCKEEMRNAYLTSGDAAPNCKDDR